MDDSQDPLIERLDDARSRVERLLNNGLDDPAMREVLLIREDLVFMERQRRYEQARVRQMLASKVERNPAAAKSFWLLLPVVASAILGYIVYQLTAGSA